MHIENISNIFDSTAIIMLSAPIVFEAWQHIEITIMENNLKYEDVFTDCFVKHRRNMFATDLQQVSKKNEQTPTAQGLEAWKRATKYSACQNLLTTQLQATINDQYINAERTDLLNQYLDAIINTFIEKTQSSQNLQECITKVLRAHTLLFSIHAFPELPNGIMTLFGIEQKLLMTISHISSFPHSLPYLSQLVIDCAKLSSTLPQDEDDEQLDSAVEDSSIKELVTTNLIHTWLAEIAAPDEDDAPAQWPEEITHCSPTAFTRDTFQQDGMPEASPEARKPEDASIKTVGRKTRKTSGVAASQPHAQTQPKLPASSTARPPHGLPAKCLIQQTSRSCDASMPAQLRHTGREEDEL